MVNVAKPWIIGGYRGNHVGFNNPKNPFRIKCSKEPCNVFCCVFSLFLIMFKHAALALHANRTSHVGSKFPQTIQLIQVYQQWVPAKSVSVEQEVLTSGQLAYGVAVNELAVLISCRVKTNKSSMFSPGLSEVCRAEMEHTSPF